MKVVVRLVGKEPSVWEAPTEQTKYVQQQWTNDLSILEEAASKGIDLLTNTASVPRN